MSAIHIWIPDPQLRPGAPSDHMSWAGRYIAESYGGRRNVTILNAGDHYDLPSLSSYDRKGGVLLENQRLTDDIDEGDYGWDLLTDPIASVKRWKPRKVYLPGNHEERLYRFMRDDATFDGSWDLNYAEAWGWEIREYLEPVWIDGVCYSHYLYNPNSGRPYAGQSMDTRLKTVGHSFTQGHQQGLLYGVRSTMGGMQHGLVAGSFYIAPQVYRGLQAQNEWTGIVVCHDVHDGHYDPMFVSLDWLCKRYTGKPVQQWYSEWKAENS